MSITNSYPWQGLGDHILRYEDAQPVPITVYTANRPPVQPFEQPNGVVPLADADIAYIAQMTGNHWRKVFNVYAKLMHCAFPFYDAWQTYREHCLLQVRSGTRLLFGSRDMSELSQWDEGLHLIMGKQHAEDCGLQFENTHDFIPLSTRIFQHREWPLWVCPYFDYRQLSNEQIEILANAMRQYCQRMGYFKKGTQI